MQRRAPRWPLALVLVLVALNFLWQLGSLSYYVDEVLSIQHSLPSIGPIVHVVNQTETTPWTFFIAFHQ
jgi:hypothetical protein